jgi:hypothetical protein
MDGLVEPAWQAAPVLSVPLHHGLRGNQPAGSLELRSLYNAERVYFLATWPSPTPGGEPGVWRNLLTVHWQLPDMSATADCTVACHTATADGERHVTGVRVETIPPGLDTDLPTGGRWEGGVWTVEWARLLAVDNPYDQQMTDLSRSYPFFVKWFQGIEGPADPISDVHELRFTR